MIHPVKVFDKDGNLVKEITSEELMERSRRKFIEHFEEKGKIANFNRKQKGYMQTIEDAVKVNAQDI